MPGLRLARSVTQPRSAELLRLVRAHVCLCRCDAQFFLGLFLSPAAYLLQVGPTDSFPSPTCRLSLPMSSLVLLAAGRIRSARCTRRTCSATSATASNVGTLRVACVAALDVLRTHGLCDHCGRPGCFEGVNTLVSSPEDHCSGALYMTLAHTFLVVVLNVVALLIIIHG